MGTLVEHLPSELVGFVLTLALSLLIGFEREESHTAEDEALFGGVRTFPLIGLAGFLLLTVFPDSALPFSVGLVVLGILLAVSLHAVAGARDVGITTEVAALLTYGLGGAASRGLYWLSIAAAVVAVILLQEKHRLEGLAARVPRRELRILVRFLLLTGVILPAVPNHPFTTFEINPFTIWLVVVAVSGVSYLSYLLQLRWGAERGVFLAGLLGGAYSSTVTTVALARQSRGGERPAVVFAGAATAATGVMYLRLWVLLMLFAPALAGRLTGLFWGLGLAGVVVGAVVARLPHGAAEPAEAEERAQRRSRNPLEMTSALAFAAVFLVVIVVTRLVAGRFGGGGVLAMAGIMGTTDVDPFILGLTQVAGHGVELGVAALAVVVAAAANNLMKGVYAVVFGDRLTGRLTLALLGLLAVASLGLYSLG